MSNTLNKTTAISMIERDIENKYTIVKENGLKLLVSMSSSIPLLKAVLPSANQWLSNKERVFLPKVQSLVNLSVEAAFADPDITVECGYQNMVQLINRGIDEMIKSHSSLTLDSIDQILQILIGDKLSL